ncbi:hypothetical protein BJ878DRAFT_568696 [Calycina marina]|uniref:DUF7357 domain-containing protein n=1 Tax=Calycina marina TaxID=1763456 RepID=A0A9P8CDL8_9HELO|nr:hypothetical protein BJ878DRAFT_568696 [Calycina marina]
MRLRVTVQRYGLPDLPVVWPVESANSMISDFLEAIHDAIPIESHDWAADDYAVYLKGTNGADYECLHYQQLEKVFKEDDEVIIRPLESRDRRVRRKLGRDQITPDGRHMLDGHPFGKPMIGRPAYRPYVHIPPLKKQQYDMNVFEPVADDEEGDWGSNGFANTQATTGISQQETFQTSNDPGSNDEEEFLGWEDNELATTQGEIMDMSQQEIVQTNNSPGEYYDDYDSGDDEDYDPRGDEDIVPTSDEEDDSGDERPQAFGNGESLRPVTKDEVEGEAQGTSDSEAGAEEAKKVAEETIQAARKRKAKNKILEQDLSKVKNNDTRAKLRSLVTTFPDSTVRLAEFILNGSHGDMARAFDALVLQYDPVLSMGAMLRSLSPGTAQSRKRKRTPDAELKQLVAQDNPDIDEDGSGKEEESANPLINFYDQNGLPPGSITSGTALSAMADIYENCPTRPIRPLGPAFDKWNKTVFANDVDLADGLISTHFVVQDSQLNNHSSDNASNSTSSSGSSSDEDDEDESAEESGDSSGSPDVSSDSSSDSEDDTPEETSSKPSSTSPPNPARSENFQQSKGVDAKSRDSVAPGSGKNSTHARNLRRRNASIISRFVDKGILPAGMTTAEFSKLNVQGSFTENNVRAAMEYLKSQTSDEQGANPSQTSLPGLFSSLSHADEFEERKRSLLAQLAEEAVEVDPVSAAEPDAASQSPENVGERLANNQDSVADTSSKSVPIVPGSSKQPSEQTAVEIPDNAMDHMEGGSSAMLREESSGNTATEEARAAASPVATSDVPDSTILSPSASESATRSAKSGGSERRSRLNVGALQRMIFGSLGKRAPKTDSDKEKLKNDMMKDIGPILPPKAQIETVSDSVQEDDQDMDSWRDKIIYRAVECCEEGVVLSQPPFPFVQRWDPQQRSNWLQNSGRGGKRKQEQRYQSQFYEDSHEPKKQKQCKGKHNCALEQEYLGGTCGPNYQKEYLNYDGEPSQPTEHRNEDVEMDVTQQLMQNLEGNAIAAVNQEPDDLASLPDNPSTLPDLLVGQMKRGATIAFKQLLMGEETNWQPVLSAYRTAIVIDSSLDGEIELCLAKRDRAQSNIAFDESTGQRLYGRFDMPVDEEDEEPEVNDGKLYVRFEDMTEPKLLAQSQEPIADDSATLSHQEDQPEAEAQLSHITETPLHSCTSITSVTGELQQPHQDIIEIQERPDETLNIEEKTPKRPTSSMEHEGVSAGALIPGDEEDHVYTANLPDAMSEANRERISRLMKEAGFGSSLSSSINKSKRPEGMESPGDEALFEQLRREMAEVPINPPYSPRFNGISPSSPTRKPRHVSLSPSKDKDELESSPRPQPSWQTVESVEASNPAEKKDNDTSGHGSWEDVEGSNEVPKSPPSEHRRWSVKEEVLRLLETSKLSNIKKKLEQFPKLSSPTLRASMERSNRISRDPSYRNTSSASAPTTDASALTITSAAEADIEYPRLSIASSFVSHVGDHGRQPDDEFGDSVTLTADATMHEDDFIPLADDSFHPNGAFLQMADDELTDVDAEPDLSPSHQASVQTSSAEQELQRTHESTPVPPSVTKPVNGVSEEEVECHVCHTQFVDAAQAEDHISSCLDHQADSPMEKEPLRHSSQPPKESETSSPRQLVSASASERRSKSPEAPQVRIEFPIVAESPGSSESSEDGSASDDLSDLDDIISASQKAKGKRRASSGYDGALSVAPVRAPLLPKSQKPVSPQVPRVSESQLLLRQISASQTVSYTYTKNARASSKQSPIVWDLTRTSNSEPDADVETPVIEYKPVKSEKATFKKPNVHDFPRKPEKKAGGQKAALLK